MENYSIVKKLSHYFDVGYTGKEAVDRYMNWL